MELQDKFSLVDDQVKSMSKYDITEFISNYFYYPEQSISLLHFAVVFINVPENS